MEMTPEDYIQFCIDATNTVTESKAVEQLPAPLQCLFFDYLANSAKLKATLVAKKYGLQTDPPLPEIIESLTETINENRQEMIRAALHFLT